MTLKNLSDKEIKTINGGGLLFNWCGYGCGYSFFITDAIVATLENGKDIFARILDLMPSRPSMPSTP